MSTWPLWEAYAHLVADLAVQKRHGLLSLPAMPLSPRTRATKDHLWRINHAFIEGWSGFKPLAGDYEPTVYQSGQLARMVFEDRDTSVTRIIEFFSAHPRGRYTAEEINELVFDKRVALYSTSTHLRWCVVNSYVDYYEVFFGDKRPRYYRYRPAATRPR